MRKTGFIVTLIVAACLLVAGTVWASSWGTYLGYPIAQLKVDGEVTHPSSPAIVIKGSTYVPLRFVSEQLGADVAWDGSTSTVTINTTGSPATEPVSQPTTRKLPMAASDKGVTLTLLSVDARPGGTTLRVKVTNDTNMDVDFPASLTQVVAGSTQFDSPSDYDITFVDDLRPGVSKQGEIKFPALPPGTTQIKVYTKVWIGSVLNSFDPVFTVPL